MTIRNQVNASKSLEQYYRSGPLGCAQSPQSRLPQVAEFASVGGARNFMSKQLLLVLLAVVFSFAMRATAAENIRLASPDEIGKALKACDKPVVRVDEIPYYVMLSL